MIYTPSLQALLDALRMLPGVGPKSAQRLAFYLLEHRQNATMLNLALSQVDKIRHCERCRNYSEQALCPLCQNVKRDQDLLCIVETPADVAALESSHSYRGQYFILHGHLSPIDGIGPEEIGIHALETRFRMTPPKEIIVATNPTAEGEATAYYIAKIAHKYQIPTTRIAHGIPMGGELEYIDGNTLALALNSRRKLETS